MKMKENYKPKPQISCATYMIKNNATPIIISKEEFDKLTKEKQFRDGPYRETFGEGYGEPYNPFKQAYGQLNNENYVFCELDKEINERTKKYLSELEKD